MKNRTKDRLIPILFWGIAFSLLMAILRTVFLFTAYDSQTGYWGFGVLPNLLGILYAIGVIVCAASPLLLPQNSLFDAKNPSRLLSGSVKGFNALIFFLGGVMFVVNGAQNSKIIELLTGILLILSTLYFLLSAISEFQKDGQKKHTALCFFTIFAFILLLSGAYFDMTTAINGPFTTLYLFALLSCAIFILNEIRSDIGCALPRFHLAASLVAFLLAFSSSVSNLLFCLFGGNILGRTASDPMRHLLLLAFSLFVLLRLLSFRTAKKEK